MNVADTTISTRPQPHSVQRMDCALAMNQHYVMKEGVACTTPASFVAEVEKYVANEAGKCRNKKDGLMVETVECCPGEIVSIPTSATEFLCDVGQVT